MLNGLKRDVSKLYTKLRKLSSPSKTLSAFLFDMKPYGVGEYYFGDEKNLKLNVLIDGDSTASGYGASNFENTITALVGNRLAKKGFRVKVKNISKAGAQVTSLYKKLVPLEDGPFDLAILIVGSNDLFALKKPKITSRSLKKVLEKYSRFSRRIIFMGPGRVDILSGILEKDKDMYRELGLEMSQSFNEIIGNFKNVFFSDPQTLIEPTSRYHNLGSLEAEDGFHPNDIGYSIYAMDLLNYGLEKFNL